MEYYFFIIRGVKKSKMQNKFNKIFLVMTCLAVLISILPIVLADECIGQSCSTNITLTLGNNAPVITEVEDVGAITLNGGTTKAVTIVFNATDNNGYVDLNFATAQAVLHKEGETDRTSSECHSILNDTTISTISCTITMQFYDGDGSWTINTTIEDLSTAKATNDTTTAIVNALDYVTQDVNSVGWASVTSGTDDNEADNTITLTNGGNQLYAGFTITGQNATGNTYIDVIETEKFSVDSLTGRTSGQIYMIDNTAVDVSSKLNLNAKGSSVTEEIFFYVDLTAGLSADTYTSDSNWAIVVS